MTQPSAEKALNTGVKHLKFYGARERCPLLPWLQCVQWQVTTAGVFFYGEMRPV